MKHNRRLELFGLVVMLALGLGVETAGALDRDDKKNQGEAARGTAVLWRDPGNVAGRDLRWGIGSPEGAPKPPFRFVEEDSSGTNPKVKVVDAAGVAWSMKFDEEVHAEVAASRIAWALGYLVEESYFVGSGRIEGARGLGRAGKFIDDNGAFRDARFEKRPEDVVRRGVEWSWTSNPFVGSKKLSGLILLNALVGNWDTKESNNEVLAVRGPGGTTEDWYVVSDWGGSFGEMGGIGSRSKWDLESFQKEQFIKAVSSGQLELNHKGTGGTSFRSVPVEHARWFVGLARRLTDEQLRTAFRASGASPAESEAFARELRERIGEIEAAVGGRGDAIVREQ